MVFSGGRSLHYSHKKVYSKNCIESIGYKRMVFLLYGELSKRFLNFAEFECKNSSQLYEYIAQKIAYDDELLELASHAIAGQPVPNMLFGAVHFLLLGGVKHELAGYYSSLVVNPKDIESAFAPFKHFCLQYYQNITDILQAKMVQTNEVRRCAYLYPAFSYIYELTKKPLSLIEIGTSAGLTLIWDEFCYNYGSAKVFGNKDSGLLITSEVIGENKPVLPATAPPVVFRKGIDLNVIDLFNYDDYLRLLALIWPEHREGRELFRKAAECFKSNPAELVEGDGVQLLLEAAETVPSDSTLCIFHTHVGNQLSKDKKEMLFKQIRNIGESRNVFHLYNNMGNLLLHLDSVVDGQFKQEIVAKTDGHARWFQWKLEEII